MSGINPNLAFFVERLAGFSTNTFRLECMNKDSATSSDIVSIDLPSNSICNMRSFKLLFNADANLGPAPGQGARLVNAESLVERIEVQMGGIVLAQGTSFDNTLRHAKRCLEGDYSNSLLGHTEMVRQTSYVNGTALAASGGGAAPNEITPPAGAGGGVAGDILFGGPAAGDVQYCIDDWSTSFIGTCEPRLLDLSLYPTVRIRLYMASDNHLAVGQGGAAAAVGDQFLGNAAGQFADSAGNNGTGSAAPATGARYQLHDLHAQIECIGLADSTYDNMLQSVLSSQGYLECPYKSYNTFNDTHAGATKFSVSSASLDRVWLAWRASNYNTQQFPVRIRGTKSAGAVPAVNDTGIPNGSDSGGVLENSREKYNSNYFNFISPEVPAVGALRMQLTLNSASIPQYRAPVADLLALSQNSVQSRGYKGMTLDQYKANYFVQCFRLNMPDSEFHRLLSGIDCRGINLAGVVSTEGATNGSSLAAPRPNCNLMVFAESTSVLRVGVGRSIEIIA